MKDTSPDKLLEQIENLRSQLHSKVGYDVKLVENEKVFKDHEILKISKELDQLILQYMAMK